ncbi:MAG: hypothetical protein HYZ45_03820 [Burkholderiales bacterium]|nr:hypothetical protein [Burkholderiales bacterium]
MSLLLLISQQMGLAHAVSHLNYPANTSTLRIGASGISGDSLSANDRTSEATPQQIFRDLSCEQCLAFAQLASALPFDIASPPDASAQRLAPHEHVAAGIVLPTIALYQSRAPPVLS